VTLASRRIYILPTPAGLVFGAMLATMLAGAMNYNNNLAFALTFVLAGVGVGAIYHTHRALAGLHLHYLGAEPVFAGDPLHARIALVNDTESARDEVFLDWAGGPEAAGGTGALDSRTVHLALPTRHRGLLALPRLRVSSRAPLGLMRAWAWIHLDARVVVYPRPAAASPPAPAAGSAAADGAAERGDEDFAGLRAWQPGDSPRRVAWRATARAGEPVVRDLRRGVAPDLLWIDWDALPPGDTETRVAQLARLVIDACAAGRSWGLRLPGAVIEPGRGAEQLHRCLRALATAGSHGDAA
jgi:uncharacterized protein (DUF58 family)